MAMTSPKAQTLFVAASAASIAASQTTAGATALNLTVRRNSRYICNFRSIYIWHENNNNFSWK